MKATSLFGGVQVLNIIIQIIRAKVVAILLGPTGIGIMGLFTSTIGIIGNLTNLGLGTSAVKDIAAANSTGNNQQISLIVTVFKRFVWITGILGTLITLILSPWLSQLSFGNRNYTFGFAWISITLLINQLSSAQLVILQGMRKLQNLAKANLLGSALGLLVTLPLYYIWGVNGIVPGIIGTALVALLLSWAFSQRVIVKSIKVPRSQTITVGKNMVRVGFMISLSGLLTVGSSYIVRIFISRTGSIEQLGLYNAGLAIINTYVGLIFNAMGTDYYPRLSVVSNDNCRCKQTINQQAEIAILILAPIIMIFLIFINWVVILLYSKQFIAVNGMIYWAALGMFFKAISWSIGYLFLAKGAIKIFFWNELAANIYIMLFNLLGYNYWGLTGIGFSFFISYILVLIQVFYVSKIKFTFLFEKALVKIFAIQFGLAVMGFLTIKYLHQPNTYIVGLVLIAISSWYSILELDKRLGLLTILKNYKKKDKL